jgi:hypothetical protein
MDLPYFVLGARSRVLYYHITSKRKSQYLFEIFCKKISFFYFPEAFLDKKATILYTEIKRKPKQKGKSP